MRLCQQIMILKKCHFRANTGPVPCLQAQCNQNPSLLLLVGGWTTISWRNYHQAFSATTPIWDVCKFGVCLIYVRNALNPSRIDKNTNRYDQRCLSSKWNQLRSRNVLFLQTWNFFTLHVQWSSGVAQMHPLTPPSYPLCYTLPSLLLNTTYHSHLYIFIFCSLYKSSKKTCEVYSEVNVFWS